MLQLFYTFLVLTSALGCYVIGAVIGGIVGGAGEVVAGSMGVATGLIIWMILRPWGLQPTVALAQSVFPEGKRKSLLSPQSPPTPSAKSTPAASKPSKNN